MTKKEFIKLLHLILMDKQQQNNSFQIKYIAPYDQLYNKCLLGYDLSHIKQTPAYTQDRFNFKITNTQTITPEATSHLKYVIETLVKCYSKEEVVNVLKDM